MDAKITAVDFYNGAVSDTNQALSSAASDKDHTGGIGSYGVSLDINYGCPIIYEGAGTLKIRTCPGYNNGIMIWRR